MDDKRALLERLSLDRAEVDDGRRNPAAIIAAVLVAAALGAGATWLVMRTGPAEETGSPAQPSGEVPGAAAMRDEAASATTPANGEATQPAAKPGERILNASGYVIARRQATVSAEITGRIVEVLVEEGMAVAAGQPVARLDDALAQADLQVAQSQVAAAEADVEGARADLAEARRVLERTRALSAEKFSSEADFTRAEADVAMKAAALSRAQANLELARAQAVRAQERVADHVIRAPFAGIVTEKNAQPGEIVSPASAGGGFTRTGICTLVDMDSLEIEVDVNEAFIARVREGQPVEARLDAYADRIIPARVIAIIPTANRNKATVQVRIGFDELDPRILPEMGVNVAFLQAE